MPAPESIKILTEQLGKQLFVMLGTKNISYGKTKKNNDDFLQFEIQGSKKVSHVQIIYEAHLDTYRIKYFKSIPAKRMIKYTTEEIKKSFEPVVDVNNLYAEDLHESIETHTGLFVKLNR